MRETDSILLQCLATTSLLGELRNSNFLQSEYFAKLPFANEDVKEILLRSGLGNPATMQMMLYALLAIPKERLLREDYDELEKMFSPRINVLTRAIVEKETTSTYQGEGTLADIDYFYHIRNAVAHSRCHFSSENNKNYVTFEDWMPGKKGTCFIKMESYKIGYVLMELQRLIMEHYNKTNDNDE